MYRIPASQRTIPDTARHQPKIPTAQDGNSLLGLSDGVEAISVGRGDCAGISWGAMPSYTAYFGEAPGWDTCCPCGSGE